MTSSLAKYLCDLLTPHIPKEHCAKDTFSFVEEINQVSFPSAYMVSFDVESLFTNIPLDETIKLAVNTILHNNKELKITKKELTTLFEFATKQTHFLFENEMYDQIDGVAMGSPLGPVLANLFMGAHENIWLQAPEASKVLFYRRYVDDIFCVFPSSQDVPEFFNFINDQHPNIRFTVENEVNGKLPFLDVLIRLGTDLKFHTTSYRKPTYTGLLTNFFSFTPSSYKTGLVRTLIDRALKINSSRSTFYTDCGKIKFYLQKNSFPLKLLDSIIAKVISDKTSSRSVNTDDRPSPRYYKLPFIGNFSSIAQKKLNSIIKHCCKDTVAVKLVFTPFKIGSLFSLKDSLPLTHKSHVVYKFSCAGCNASYIGETTRQLGVRANEHLETDTKSSVFRHLHNQSLPCKEVCDFSCFSILDSAQTQYQLRIKEGLYVAWNDPSLNKQVKCYKVSITV